MNRVLHRIIQVLIVFGMLLGAALFVMIVFRLNPFPGAQLFLNVNGSGWRGYVSGGLAIISIFGCEYIGCILLKMMHSLDKDPFVTANVTALRKMGFIALFVMVCALLTIVFRFVPLLAVGALPIGMCGLFSLALAEVYAKAVAAKQENDLTI